MTLKQVGALIAVFVAIITSAILIVSGYHLNMYAELLNFTASLADSLSWPIVIIFAMNVLKPHLGKLIASIRSIETPLGNIQMADSIHSTAEKVEDIAIDDGIIVAEFSEQPIDQDPRISILKTWASIEAAIERLAELSDLREPPKRRLSTYRRIEMLRERDLIDDPLANVLHEMRKVRNLIAHGQDVYIEYGAVQEFLLATLRVEAIIESIHDRQQRSDLINQD